MRGAEIGISGLPLFAAAYHAVPRAALPKATTTLNILQRLGGPRSEG